MARCAIHGSPASPMPALGAEHFCNIPLLLSWRIRFVSSDQAHEPFLDRQCKHRMEDLSLAEISSNAVLTSEAGPRWLIAVNEKL